ncbi:MAG: hypothetical protein ACON5J_10625 [Rubripirellula sp.]
MYKQLTVLSIYSYLFHILSAEKVDTKTIYVIMSVTVEATETAHCVYKFITYFVTRKGEFDRKMNFFEGQNEKLKDEFERVWRKFDEQESKIQSLKKTIDGYEQAKHHQKEFYTVKDLAELCVRGEVQIRRYLSSGLISGRHAKGRWIISAEEFQRVREVVETKGVSFLEMVK